MDLRYYEKSAEVEMIEDRLNKLTLAYKLVQDNTSKYPALIDGSKIYSGLKSMNEYIDKLDNEKGQWYYCSC